MLRHGFLGGRLLPDEVSEQPCEFAVTLFFLCHAHLDGALHQLDLFQDGAERVLERAEFVTRQVEHFHGSPFAADTVDERANRKGILCEC